MSNVKLQEIMRKGLFITAIITLIFNACSPYELSDPVTAEALGKATVTGVAFANIDLRATEINYAPEGTKIKFTTDYSNFGITSTTGVFAKETTVKENGEYVISLPAVANAVTYTISCEEFVADEQSAHSSSEKVYSVSGAQTIAVRENFTYLKNYTYTAAPAISTTLNWSETGKFVTKLEYVRDENTATLIEIPTGTEVIVTIDKDALKTENDKVFSVNVESGGRLTIEHLCPPLTESPNFINIKLAAAVILPVKKLSATEDSYEVYSIPAAFTTFPLRAGYTKEDVKTITLQR